MTTRNPLSSASQLLHEEFLFFTNYPVGDKLLQHQRAGYSIIQKGIFLCDRRRAGFKPELPSTVLGPKLCNFCSWFPIGQIKSTITTKCRGSGIFLVHLFLLCVLIMHNNGFHRDIFIGTCNVFLSYPPPIALSYPTPIPVDLLCLPPSSSSMSSFLILMTQ